MRLPPLENPRVRARVPERDFGADERAKRNRRNDMPQ